MNRNAAANAPTEFRAPRCGDAAAVVAAILGGAHIVRVHDPGAILPAVRVADALLAAHTLMHP